MVEGIANDAGLVWTNPVTVEVQRRRGLIQSKALIGSCTVLGEKRSFLSAFSFGNPFFTQRQQ